jgi:hypothetical protein
LHLHVGPGIQGKEDFDSFCVFPKKVALDDMQVAYLRKVIAKDNPKMPLYVFTRQGSNVINKKAKIVNNVF